ncbi:hypothetical protein ACNOYE_17845 [Nannocystaceae bacterium ST9]
MHVRIPILAPLVFLAIASGCYAEPHCAVDGVVEGGVSGVIGWRGVGEGQCQLNFDSLEFSVGEDRLILSSFYDDERSFGQHDTDVLFESAGQAWVATGCYVDITRFEREDWTQDDYFYVAGSLSCPGLIGPTAQPVYLTDVAFSGYLIEGL